MQQLTVAILGGGAMGTACGWVLARNGHRAVLVPREPSRAADINDRRENVRHLPGVTLPEGLSAAKTLPPCDAVLVAVPSRFLRQSLTEHRPPGDVRAISVVKGIEADTLARPSEIITAVWGPRPVAVLGGPSHAEEIVARQPTSVVAAGEASLAADVQTAFGNDRFRVYTNADVAGVELSGALKNVIGLAAGICDGVGFGDNAKAALLTRAISEMGRFGQALGADPQTFAGLAGVGDLITTCVSPHGRNRAVGERLGRGETLDQITAGVSSVAEGVSTARAVAQLAHRHGVEMPIVDEVCAVLFEGKSPQAATDSLMTRPYRDEQD